jgi:dimethylargininase
MPEKMASTNNCFKYNFAIVSRIANSFRDSSSFDLKSGSSIDIDKARREHEALVESLRRISLDVIELPCDEKHPDGLFVDDIAVVINGTALICNPPTIKDRPSRQGELAVVRQVLRKELGLKITEVDSESALVEGGDVLWTGRDIFVGISTRTNLRGAQAVATAFPEYPCYTVKVYHPAIHLKDYITMAGPEVMAVGKSEGAQKTFKEIQNAGGRGYRYISLEEDEAANVLYCNGTLVHLASEQIPKGHAVYENKIDYPRVGIPMREPLKRGGRLGSCVLLIARVRTPKKIPMSS